MGEYDKNRVNNLLECMKKDANDKDSVTELYKMLAQSVYYIALSHLNMLRPSWKQNFMDAKDLIGDTFVAVIKQIDKFRYSQNGPAWIFKITERLCKKFVSKRRNETELKPGFIDLKAERSLEDKIAVSDILSSLKAHELEIILLHYYFGYTYSEISAILKKSVPGIKKIISDIKKRNRTDDS